MPFILFLAAVYLSVVLVQSIITFPVEFLSSIHLPFWLMLVMGGGVLAWLMAE
jgi:hypothetical protein